MPVLVMALSGLMIFAVMGCMLFAACRAEHRQREKQHRWAA